MPRFRSILVDIDATAAVHPAFNEACDLAARFGATVALVDVMSELPRREQNVITRQADQELVNRRMATLVALARGRLDISVSTAVLRGKPAIAIIQQVLRANHDLVVRSHARDLVPGRMYGAVDMQLLRNCPCPVWLIGPEAAAHPPHILAAVDTESDEPGTDQLNRTILDVALTLGEARHARVIVVHAWSLYGEDLLRPRMQDQIHEVLEAAQKAADNGVAALVKEFGDRAADARIECIKGDPRTVISRYATTQKIDLVVMGTVGRTGIAGFIMGNTAEAVLRELHGSVLAVKPPGFVTPVTLLEHAEQSVGV
jgi:universal stress protein E